MQSSIGRKVQMSVSSEWSRHKEKWQYCERCPLHCVRDKVVLFRGLIPCKVLFVGEAPGESENSIGAPFVGEAGALLDQLLEEVFPSSSPYAITNIVACIPKTDLQLRDPTKEEAKACQSRLVSFIQIASPKLIVTLGNIARKYLPGNATIPVCHLVHPSYILRLPNSKMVLESKRFVTTLQRNLRERNLL